MFWIAQPKSASSSLGYTLAKILKVKCINGLVTKPKRFCNDFPEIQKWHNTMLPRYMPFLVKMHKDKKVLYKEHILPSERQMDMVRDFPYPLMILLRNPDETFDSYRRFNENEVFQKYKKKLVNLNQIKKDVYLFFERYKQLEAENHKHLLFIYYKDLVLNFKSTLKKIFAHYKWKLPTGNIELMKIKYTGVGIKKYMDSNKLKNEYDKEYYLNRVEGHEAFKDGKIDDKKYQIIDKLDVENKKVLDIGFGRGETIKICRDRGATKVIGVDFSNSAYDIAEKYLEDSKGLYLLDIANIDELKENNVDIVLMFDIIEHISNQELNIFLQKIRTKIKKKTVFHLCTPVNIMKGDYKGMHINQWTEKKIFFEFGKYFKGITIDYIRNDSILYIRCVGYEK